MEGNTPWGYFSRLGHNFRSEMVRCYLDSFLRENNAEAVVALRSGHQSVLLTVSSIEFREDGAFLAFGAPNNTLTGSASVVVEPQRGLLDLNSVHGGVEENLADHGTDEASDRQLDVERDDSILSERDGRLPLDVGCLGGIYHQPEEGFVVTDGGLSGGNHGPVDVGAEELYGGDVNTQM
jgi:hypothetical protein